MAIYSLSMRSVGRTTHAPGTAGAHMRYIARERAASEIVANHIPEDANAARAYVDAHEAGLRKNARIMDKIMIALPRELSDTERGQLVQDYMNDLTQGGRVPWYAALHQTESDAHNPHAHVVVIDKDIETGKRVLALSDSRRDRIKKGLDPSAAEWVRERWEHHANTALERAGYDARIDRRSLEKQGIEREPQIHIGPNAQHIDTFVRKPESKIVPDPTAKNPERVIDYPMIDAGRTRRERVAEIIDFNLAKQARSEHFETRVMAQFEREQRSVERVLDAQIIVANRKRSIEERRIRAAHAEQVTALRSERDASAQIKRDWFKQQFWADKASLRASHDQEARILKEQQNRLWGRIWARLDVSGATRQRRESERQELALRQRAERDALRHKMEEARAAQNAQMQRFKDLIRAEQLRRHERLQAMAERQKEERRKDDILLQQRASDREQARQAVVQQIAEWKRQQVERAARESLRRLQKYEKSRRTDQQTRGRRSSVISESGGERPTPPKPDWETAARQKSLSEYFKAQSDSAESERRHQMNQKPSRDQNLQNQGYDRDHK